MFYYKPLACFLLCLCSMTAAAEPIDSLFAKVPREVLPMFDRTARLDMLDLYNSKLAAKAENTYGGQSEMRRKTDDFIELRLTDVSTWQMKILPIEQDTIICCLLSIEAMGTTTSISYYNQNWKPINTPSPAPQFADFISRTSDIPSLRKSALCNILRQQPIAASLSYSTRTIAFAISTEGLTPSEQEEVRPLLHSVTYTWENGQWRINSVGTLHEKHELVSKTSNSRNAP